LNSCSPRRGRRDAQETRQMDRKLTMRVPPN
jgi:hypothetical protein